MAKGCTSALRRARREHNADLLNFAEHVLRALSVGRPTLAQIEQAAKNYGVGYNDGGGFDPVPEPRYNENGDVIRFDTIANTWGKR